MGLVGVGSTALAGVERVNGGELVVGQLEVEDVEVLRDPRRPRRLRDDLAAFWMCHRNIT